MAKDIVRRDPLEMLAPFFNISRRWTEALQGASDAESGRMMIPLMDIAETEDAIVISTELPGLAKKDVKITIENGVLTMSGEKPFAKDESTTYHVVERRYGSFHRQVTLSNRVDASRAKATFNDGILTIAVPKAEAAKPRELEID